MAPPLRVLNSVRKMSPGRRPAVPRRRVPPHAGPFIEEHPGARERSDEEGEVACCRL